MKNALNVDERRRDARVEDAVGFAMKVVAGDAAGSFDYSAIHMTRNISMGGVCFRDRMGLPRNTRVEMRLALRTINKVVSQTGRVCWTIPDDGDSYEMGVEFVSASAPDKAAWARYVHQSRETGS